MKGLHIRPATLQDLPRILEIYTPLVVETAVSFETVVPSLAEMEARFNKVTTRHPFYVAELSGTVIAYAYASTFRDRPAYDRACELSVYVHQDHRGAGAGSALYRHLVADLKTRGFTEAIAGTTLPNDASVRLHTSVGFRHVGTFERVGQKLGRWWDVAFYQLSLTSEGSDQS